MKGVNYISDNKNRKTAVVIDLKVLEKYDEQIEDLFDTIIAESREDEENIPLEDVIKSMKAKAGKK